MALAVAVLLGLFLLKQDQSPFMRPVKRVLPGLFLRLEQPVAHLLAAGNLRAENRRLLQQLGREALDVQLGREAMIENRRLRIQLGLKARSAYRLHPAEVVGRAVSGLPGLIHLTFAERDSLRPNLALVTPQGLAGRLTSLLPGGGLAQSIASPGFRVGALDQRSRVQGILRWLHDNVCVLEGIPARADIQVGDAVVTAGQSRIYPGGLLIGHVFIADTPEKGLFKKVYVSTSVDFSAMEQVLIVLPLAPAAERGGR